MIPKEMNKALWAAVEKVILEHTKDIDKDEKAAFVVSMIMLISKAIDIALKIEISKLIKEEQQKESDNEKGKREKRTEEEDQIGEPHVSIIPSAKKDLLERTNIETSKEEMACLDAFIFRCWQMGWLKQYENKEEAK